MKSFFSNKTRRVLLFCLLSVLSQMTLLTDASAVLTRLNTVKIPVAKSDTEHWLFSGVVSSENGLAYAYYFLLDRTAKEWRLAHQLLDLQTSQIVFEKKITETLPSAIDGEKTWRIGPALFQHNAISDSWVIGLNLSEKNKLNFRLNNATPYHRGSNKIKNLPEHMKTASDMRINGNLTIDGQDFFVSGKDNWFVHQWGEDVRGLSKTSYQRLFCSLGKRGTAFVQKAEKPLNGAYSLIEAFKMSEKLGAHRWFILNTAESGDDKNNWVLESALTTVPLKLSAHQPIVWRGGGAIETKLFAASDLTKGGTTGYCFVVQHRVS